MSNKMNKIVFLVAIIGIFTVRPSRSLSLYEYYAPEGVPTSGLVAEGDTFTLNGKNLTIFSGSFHYFRIHPDYWRETLQKIRAAGLNAVQTYVPWNLHEPRQGVFDFGSLGEDMSIFLDLRAFVQLAQEEDLFVILRPGPYICSEWDFGGLPSWLLRDPTMHVRTYYDNFRFAAMAFFEALLPQVADLEFIEGGPIISVQIENEYGIFGYDDEPRDRLYLAFLRDLLVNGGLGNSLLFTSDPAASTRDLGSLRGVLQTANFQTGAEDHLSMLRILQPSRPLMVTEFQVGWFDFWLADTHSVWNVEDFASTLEYLLAQNVSLNIYVFIGGTNFGFTAGSRVTTSYDYGAPLSEAGDYTEKYNRLVDIFSRYNPLLGVVDNPAAPVQREKAAYGASSVTEVLPFTRLIAQAPKTLTSEDGPVNMEALDINEGNGQSYGYVLYSTDVFLQAPQSELIIRGHIRDMAQVLVDGVLLTLPYEALDDTSAFGFWDGRDKNLTLPGAGALSRFDILVENLGRTNVGAAHKFVTKKGLWEGDVLINRQRVVNWTMTPLEFSSSFVNGLTGWEEFTKSEDVPAVYRTTLTLTAPLLDTFLDMRSWNKGVVFVNGFNIGRYWSLGPQRTLYVPAPLLLEGENQITVFEQYAAADEVVFIDFPILS